MHLINEIMKNLPSISAYIDQNVAKLEKELKALGGDVNHGRGSMLHLILTLCRKLEEAFAKIVDGKKDGGERILEVCVRDPQVALPVGLRKLCALYGVGRRGGRELHAQWSPPLVCSGQWPV